MGTPATRGVDAAALLPADAQHRLIAIFQRAADAVPAYRAILERQHIDPAEVSDLSTFALVAPVLCRASTFDRFPIDQLGFSGPWSDVGNLQVGSDDGSRFSFRLGVRRQAPATIEAADEEFDAAFGVKTRSTLAINCLPLGVGFSSRVMTVATVSVREDMAVGLIQAFGRHYDQLLLIGESLFLKRLTDYAETLAIDWSAYRVNVIVSDGVPGEHYRTYLASRLKTDLNDRHAGFIMGSYDVGELGLRLGYETRATVALRRAAHLDPVFAEELLGVPSGEGLPMIFAFNPERTFVEALEADAAGYGKLTVSMLEPDRRIPLLRYQTGEVGAILNHRRATLLADHYGVALPEQLPAALFVVRGRSGDVLPNGVNADVYTDLTYADPSVAQLVSGAVRLIESRAGLDMHVQLVRGAEPSSEVEQRLLAQFHPSRQPDRLFLWVYSQFPYGMTLDYERKFVFSVPGESAVQHHPAVPD